MKQFYLSCLTCIVLTLAGYSNDKDSAINDVPSEQQVMQLANYMTRLDSVEKTINYQKGSIRLPQGSASLNVPSGFKFINAQQSQYILEDLWQNLPDASVLGMIVSDSFHVNSIYNSWVFVVTFNALGYVKDDDADETNYEELLVKLKEGEKEANLQRAKLGYDRIEIVGWASKPYYDKQNKVLHWAKELAIDGSRGNTLNYDVRVLGRNGVLSLNAVAGMDQLEEVKKNIPAILKMASFEQGHTYSEFNPKVDEVAAWTIGGLVAGKVLMKAGFLVGLLKFWKLIAIGFVALASFIWKFFVGKRQDETYAVEPAINQNENSSAL